MSFVFIYVTCKDEQEARTIAKQLLENKQIACANFFPIKSMYWWENKINEDDEFVLIVKTKEELFKKVKEEVKKLHSYNVPCITKISVEPNSGYASWLDKQINGK